MNPVFIDWNNNGEIDCADIALSLAIAEEEEAAEEEEIEAPPEEQ